MATLAKNLGSPMVANPHGVRAFTTTRGNEGRCRFCQSGSGFRPYGIREWRGVVGVLCVVRLRGRSDDGVGKPDAVDAEAVGAGAQARVCLCRREVQSKHEYPDSLFEDGLVLRWHVATVFIVGGAGTHGALPREDRPGSEGDALKESLLCPLYPSKGGAHHRRCALRC